MLRRIIRRIASLASTAAILATSTVAYAPNRWESATVTDIDAVDGIVYVEVSDGNVYGYYVDSPNMYRTGVHVDLCIDGDQIIDAVICR